MSKLLKATKRISAVATSALLMSSAAFASLGNYPSGFVMDGKFSGQVVIGDNADADMAAAISIIDELRNSFSGSNEKVRLTYKKTTSEGGEVVSAVKDNRQLNYGETLGTVTETSGFDDTTTDILDDGKFVNDLDDTDYEQLLDLDPAENIKFNKRLYDEVDADEMETGIYLGRDTIFATYSLEFDSEIDVTGTDATDDLVGGTLDIMGQEFTVGSVSLDSSKDVDELELLGGANKFSLSEGEQQTVNYDGNSVEIQVTNVDSEGKVRLVVNGVAEIVERYDVKEVNGIDIAVIDSVGATGDGIVGAAEFIVGGHKITLGSDIKINDEDVDDLYPEYNLEVTFDSTSGSWAGFSITYGVDEDTLLSEGEALREVLLDTFSLVYEGTNEPEYKTFSISSKSDEVTFSGSFATEDSIPSQFKLQYTDKEDPGSSLFLGGDDYRFYHKNSRLFDIGASANDAVDFANIDGVIESDSSSTPITYTYTTGLSGTVAANDTIDNVAFTVQNDKFDDFGFLVEGSDYDEVYLYTIKNIDKLETSNDAVATDTIDFDELIQDKKEDDTKLNGLDSLEVDVLTAASDYETFTLNAKSLAKDVVFEGYLRMNLAGAEGVVAASFTTINTIEPRLTFDLETSEIDVDSTGDDAEII